MPTRFPNGLSYILPGATSGGYYAALGDVTPTVKNIPILVVGQSAQSISNFDDGEVGQNLFVFCASAATINATSSIYMATDGAVVMGSGEVIQFIKMTSSIWTVVSKGY